MNNYSQLGGGTNVYTASYQPMWDVSDTMTYVRGNHTFNAGFNYRQWKLNRDLANEFLGAFVFSGDFTGNPVADMLLGYYSGRRRLPARTVCRAREVRQSARIQLQILRALHPGRLEGVLAT